MEALAVDVTIDGKTRRLELGFDFEEHPEDLMRVGTLCGMDKLLEFAQGDWEPEAAKALVYVSLVRELSPNEPNWIFPPVSWESFDLDWGPYAPFIEADPEMEASLAGLTEEAT